MQEIWVDRKNYRHTKIIEKPLPEVGDGEILLKVDKYGLTANNVSYALSGDMIGYWDYFPVITDDDVNWGKVPVWGVADIVQSNCDGVEAGERIYGFFPMATHVVMKPGKIKEQSFIDAAEHRQGLPGLYNGYNRTQSEPEFYQSLETERCLLFPLFITGYVLADLLADNQYWDARQVLIGSVSSKTGFIMAAFLKSETDFNGKIIGLTSAANKIFVESLGDCDQVVTYGDEAKIEKNIPSIYADMSGNGELRRILHNQLGENMVRSIGVGATHWEEERSGGDMPGAKPEFFSHQPKLAKEMKNGDQASCSKKLTQHVPGWRPELRNL